MTIQNVQFSRVFLAAIFTFFAALVLYFLASCLTTPFMPTEMSERFNDILQKYLDVLQGSADESVTLDEVNSEIDALRDEYGTELYLQYIIQWSTGILATIWFGRWAAKIAVSEKQAVGYGVLVGVAVALSYGILCVMLNLFAVLLLRLIFFGLILVAGYVGGRLAGLALDPDQVARASGQASWSGDLSGPAESMPSGRRAQAQSQGDAAIYFNMGVAAAMGGRREEARQHFRTVLQHQPRNVAAWLQLANLADSPAQAWEYIQQARAISPNDPAVVDAVNVIWPQVQGEIPGAPRIQPPYKGGAMDDTDIPRSTLPGPDVIVPPEPDDDEPPTG